MNEYSRVITRRECGFVYTMDLGKRSVTWLFKVAVYSFSDIQLVCLVRSAGGHSSKGCSCIYSFLPSLLSSCLPSLFPSFIYFCFPLPVEVLGTRPYARAGDTEAAPLPGKGKW